MDEGFFPVNPGDPSGPGGPASVNRRELLKLAACASAMLTLNGVVDASAVRPPRATSSSPR
jgi:hypothetical protein